MKLSEHFTLEELTASKTAARQGIDNTPTKQARANLAALCEQVLEPLRIAWGDAIVVTSGYRCPQLNAATGGKATSQHLNGQAADIYPLNGKNKEFLELCRDLMEKGTIKFDQLINEYPDANGVPSWVHVSHTTSRLNRAQYVVVKSKKK